MVEVSNLHRTEAFVSHRDARLTVHGRRLLVERVSAPAVPSPMSPPRGASPVPQPRWIRRRRSEGESGLNDRSSRPRRTPHRTEPPPRRVSAGCGRTANSARHASDRGRWRVDQLPFTADALLCHGLATPVFRREDGRDLRALDEIIVITEREAVRTPLAPC
ncbi:leucine zipper domain-containing protein [Streptomyces humidus]|uniref:leucine zipper domain-containing protein n=1 Tax=Streptomyces humidus TaxID=52259 RepID=UPI00331A3E49